MTKMIRIDCRDMSEEDKDILCKYLKSTLPEDKVCYGLFQKKNKDYYVRKNPPMSQETKDYIFDIFDTIGSKTNTLKLCQKNNIHISLYTLNKLLTDRDAESQQG